MRQVCPSVQLSFGGRVDLPSARTGLEGECALSFLRDFPLVADRCLSELTAEFVRVRLYPLGIARRLDSSSRGILSALETLLSRFCWEYFGPLRGGRNA